LNHSKLPPEQKFIDLSDFGRPIAQVIANSLKKSFATPIHLTIAFVIAGLIAIYFILIKIFIVAFIFLILKSILDAADGELARIKNTPSYTGRYLDSVSDFILNFLILLAIGHVSNTSIIYTVIAFFALELQGTLYNYYYVILRRRYNGDTTSRVFENETPNALEGEKQSHVNTLFKLYKSCYGMFDRIIYVSDKKAIDDKHLPKWFMSFVSIYGLGFQLLLIGTLLVTKKETLIIPFLISYSVFIFIFIFLRRLINFNK